VGRGIGLTEPELALLAEGQVPPTDDERERASLRLTLALLDGDIADADWERWSALLGPRAIFELSTLVGYYATLALQLRIFRVGVEPS
jgi:4-carboxymuconolactone decarboxylase